MGLSASGLDLPQTPVLVLRRPLKMIKFDLPITINTRVEYWVDYFCGRGRPYFEKYLLRSEYYAPYIQAILRSSGMPEDLVYLAMIESGFNNLARSHARAVGPWQFISATGKRYGLTVNWWIDERRDIRKSTLAAAAYLKDLYNMFQNWELAAAAYNAGENKIGRALRQGQAKDFWQIARLRLLKQETRDYVPKLMAAAIIAKNRDVFGFPAPVVSPDAFVKDVPAGLGVDASQAFGMDRTAKPEKVNDEVSLRALGEPGAEAEEASGDDADPSDGAQNGKESKESKSGKGKSGADPSAAAPVSEKDEDADTTESDDSDDQEEAADNYDDLDRQQLTAALISQPNHEFLTQANQASVAQLDAKIDAIPDSDVKSVPQMTPHLLKTGEVGARGLVEVDLAGPVDMFKLAKALKITVDELRSFNPEVIRWVTPPGFKTYRIKIPALLQNELAKALASDPNMHRAQFLTVKVGKGDTVAKIARTFGIKVDPILDLNRIAKDTPLPRGSKVLLPIPLDGNYTVAELEIKDPPEKRRHRHKKRYRHQRHRHRRLTGVKGSRV
jgi:hypothetical protein